MTEQKPLVSIVLPTYNGAKYLAEAVESCRAQTWPNWELIIVDDCSTDATPDLIRSLAQQDPRIRSVRHERNRKLPAALNTGFAQARGEFLTWISDDNAYRPEALAEMAAYLLARPEVGLVYTDSMVVDENGRPLRVRRVPEPETLLERDPVGWSFLYRRAVRESVGDYAEEFFLSEDYDYWLRVSMRFRLAPLHKDLFLYRQHGSSLTASREKEIERTWPRMLEKHLPRLGWATPAQKAECYYMLAAAAKARRDFPAAARCWLGALRNDPAYALRRAAGKVARLFSKPAPPPDYKAAIARARGWIRANSDDGGVYFASRRREVYREVTGYYIPTLLQIGEPQTARRWAEAMLKALGPDGSVSSIDGKLYVFDTGQVMRGFLCYADEEPFREGLRRAGGYMLSQLRPDGSFPDVYDGKIPTYIFLYALEPLLEAGRRLGRPDFVEGALRALDYYERNFDPLKYASNSHFFGYAVEALIDLDRPAKAREAAAYVKTLIRPDGGLPAATGARWVCSPGQAQFARIFYKLGDLETGDRLLGWMLKNQNPSGGFFGAYGKDSLYFRDSEPCWAVKFFIDAIVLRIRRHFEVEFPSWMDNKPVPEDFRFKALCDALPDGGAPRRILEIGCGAGRFLQALRDLRPQHECVGLDLSETLVRLLPAGIRGVTGDMLNLPFGPAEFDAAFMVEALEHAPDVGRALAELMRVLKPGGRFAIIDKNAACLGRLRIMPWEQWFDAEGLLARLRAAGSDDATVSVIPAPERFADMFLIWQGTKKTGA